MFRDARSMALVGNAETILDYENGARIDAHDLVVRFNRAFVAGIEDKVGRRTDILVANPTYSLDKAPAPATVLAPRCVVSFVEPLRDTDYTKFLAWTGALPTLVTLAPDLLHAAQVARVRPVTMGTAALYTLLNLLPIERLFVTGFTFYGAAGTGHRVYWQEDRKSRGMYHDLEPEARIFVSILERFRGALEVTPEVEVLRRRYGADGSGGAPLTATRTLEELYARLGWRLIRWGLKLRHRAEAGGHGVEQGRQPKVRKRP
jgi:hypothetical protein